MRIAECAGDPAVSMFDDYVQFFLKLALESVQQGFARMYFAAGELPVACIGLAIWPACQEKRAVCTQNNGHCNLDG